MSTSTTVSFTADAGKLVLDGSRHFGPPAEIATDDFKGREPLAWAAAQEFNVNGTASGNIVVTAS